MKNLFFISLFLMIIFSGCKKEEETNDSINELTNLSQFHSKYSAPSQFHSVTAGIDTFLIGTEGTIIFIYEYSFYPIMSGEINIELREFYSRKDIILNNLQTLSDNGLLATAGMIYINCRQSGVGLNQWQIQTKMPAQTTDPNMELFLSTQQNTDSSILWTLADSSFLFIDTMGYNNYYCYIHSNNDFQWINCDYFVNQSPLTTVKATFTNAPQSAYPPRVYLVLDINAIVEMWNDYPNQGVFSINNIPEGLPGKIVAYTVVNGVCYFSKKPIIVTTNLNQSMTFQTVTEQQLINELENL